MATLYDEYQSQAITDTLCKVRKGDSIRVALCTGIVPEEKNQTVNVTFYDLLSGEEHTYNINQKRLRDYAVLSPNELTEA